MSFEPRANYGGGLDFSTFRVVLHDRSAKRRDVCLSGKSWGNQTKSRSCKNPEYKGQRKAASTDRAFTLKASREVMEMFGVLAPVYAREYLPLNFSVTFYLKELRLMNNLFNLMSEYSHHSA